MKYSLLMLTHNRIEAVAACIESMAPAFSRPDVEIMIVDNNSTDGTREFIDEVEKRFPNVEGIALYENLGVAGGRDLLAKSAFGDVCVFIDSDVIIRDQGWLDRLGAFFDDADVGAAGPASSYINWDDAGLFYPAFSGECDVVSGWCMAIRGSLLREGVIQFDVAYTPRWEEDSDLCLQVRDSGYKVMASGDIGVAHVAGNSGDVDGLRKRMLDRFRTKWYGRHLTRHEWGY